MSKASKKMIYITATDRETEEKIKKLLSQEDIEVTFIKDIPSVYKLKGIMQKLRGEHGCPWDKEQTHRTLVPYLTEEAYEVVNAIEENSKEKICEELGDLLLQIVFHCQIGEEEKTFTLEDVADGIVKKLIRRHPHIFSDVNVSGSDEVIKNWEEIKKKEKGKQVKSILEGLPEHLPALVKADLTGKKVARVGFDWPCAEEILKKLFEEIEEFQGAIKEQNSDHIKEELGDMLFTIVNLARHFDVEPEYALNSTTKKFVKRFKRLEEISLNKKDGKSLSDRTLEELDEIWELVKKEYKHETR